jgi:hypothetical protein
MTGSLLRASIPLDEQGVRQQGGNSKMMKVTKKERRHVAAHGEARLPAQRRVLLYYALARHGQDGPRLLHVPLGFGEEALLVFSSWEAGRGYYVSRRRFLSEIFSEEWYVKYALSAN